MVDLLKKIACFEEQLKMFASSKGADLSPSVK
jgi:hypothetical protein